MNVRLYVVNASHPCATVASALERKGIEFRVTELPPPMHMAFMRMRFGHRTVPAITIDGEKISGSRAIMRRLDELVPEPAMYPSDPAQRARVEEAEAWGDDVLQGYARRVLWPTFKAHPEAMHSFQAGSKLPAFPVPVLKALAPVATRIEMRANEATSDTYPEDLRALPEILDRADAFIAEGVIGGDQPNAADLQIAPSLCLLMGLGDLRPLIEARPSGQLARRLFPDFPGDAAQGMIPEGLLPAVV
jgi:glutathione S-transferase